jgi:hypothetical protein
MEHSYTKCFAASLSAIKDKSGAAHTTFPEDVLHFMLLEESLSDFLDPSGPPKLFELGPGWIEILDGVKDFG